MTRTTTMMTMMMSRRAVLEILTTKRATISLIQIMYDNCSTISKTVVTR